VTSAASKERTVREPVEQTIHRLEVFVARMERRYECSSAFAAEAVACGHMKDTAEVSRWLISYRTLQHLKALAGSETGKSTISTA
jgi:hypothetical protein